MVRHRPDVSVVKGPLDAAELDKVAEKLSSLATAPAP
jgi:hypothetical protein